MSNTSSSVTVRTFNNARQYYYQGSATVDHSGHSHVFNANFSGSFQAFSQKYTTAVRMTDVTTGPARLMSCAPSARTDAIKSLLAEIDPAEHVFEM